ncbi:MAG: GDSL-type esterase/lipase family protein [Sporomusaceae bacterium]|nr:GDSL-type esterase/lipase family protein [Sporomusaceae bacterium]
MPGQQTIVALGDSLTYGFPYSPDRSWVQLSAAELGITLLNRGVNGDTTAGMLRRFSGDVLACQPSHVIILGGTNDIFERIDAENAVHHIRLMAQMARKRSVVPFIGLPPPCCFIEAQLANYRQALRQYAVDAAVELIDFYTPLLSPDGWGTGPGLDIDGVHPSETGYRLMAAAAVGFLRRRICG